MHPILFKIGNLNIYSYGVILAFDLLVSLYLFIKFSKDFNIDSEVAFRIFVMNIVFLIIGGKIGYMFSHFEQYYNGNLKDFFIDLPINFFYSGLAIQGAILFSALALIFVSKYYKINLWNLFDNFSLVALLSISIGRVGCLLAGCCYGKICQLCEYGIYLYGAKRYPTQVMESLLSLAAFLLIYWYFNKLKKLNQLEHYRGIFFAFFMIFYGLIRFFVEFYREGTPIVGYLNLAQIFSLLIFIIGSIIFIFVKFKFKSS